MQEARINVLINEIAVEIKRNEKRNRDLYASAIDIEDEARSLKVQSESYAALRRMKTLAADLAAFKAALARSGLLVAEASDSATASESESEPDSEPEPGVADEIDSPSVKIDSPVSAFSRGAVFASEELSDDDEEDDNDGDNADVEVGEALPKHISDEIDAVRDIFVDLKSGNGEDPKSTFGKESNDFEIDESAIKALSEPGPCPKMVESFGPGKAAADAGADAVVSGFEDIIKGEPVIIAPTVEQVIADILAEGKAAGTIEELEGGIVRAVPKSPLVELPVRDNRPDIEIGAIPKDDDDFDNGGEDEDDADDKAETEVKTVSEISVSELLVAPHSGNTGTIMEHDFMAELLAETSKSTAKEPESKPDKSVEELLAEIEKEAEVVSDSTDSKAEADKTAKATDSGKSDKDDDFAEFLIKSQGEEPEADFSGFAAKKPQESENVYADKTPLRFNMCGRPVEVSDWSDMLVKVCEILILRNPYTVAQFDKYHDLNPPSGCCFSYNRTDIIGAVRKLSNGLCVGLDHTPDEIATLCKKILELCGYPRSELLIEFA